MNVVFFGMSGQFSRIPLDALIQAGYTVSLIVTPALSRRAGPPVARIPPPTVASPSTRRSLPLLEPIAPGGLMGTAASHAIPVIEASKLSLPELLDTVAANAPEVMVAACFPWRLPAPLLALPRLGCLNLHPSLLPDNRGPDPLFWAFRRGDDRTGVTVHLMDAGYDSGAIVAQREIAIVDGVTLTALERECAEVGGRLLVEAVADLATRGSLATPQDESRATAYPAPRAEDFLISPQWTARHCENFTRGLIGSGRQILLRLANDLFQVIEPLGYDENTSDLAVPYQLRGDTVSLRCASGVWRARVTQMTD
ncbi:MAG TPA: formyltransferase family protein [Ktedonobacterales bacterium]|nr:formyltransferase family protein [Ktedonobacterales bacterium]